MGWDCSVGASVDLGGKEPFWVQVYEGGHTFNCAPMWRTCGATPPREWPEDCAAAIPVLERNIQLFDEHRNALRELDPVNGWGSYETAAEWQRQVLTACRRAPKAKLSVT